MLWKCYEMSRKCYEMLDLFFDMSKEKAIDILMKDYRNL